MAFDIKDLIKDNKKLLLPVVGLVVLVLFLGLLMGNGYSPFTLDNNITGNGVNNIIEENDMRPTYTKAPSFLLEKGKDYQATIKTDFGNIVIDLFEDETPLTVNNFVFLAKNKFYDNITFHRVVKGFVLQGGDPKGNGTGGPGYSFNDEIDAKALGLEDIKVKDATYLKSFYPSNVLSQYENSSVADFYTKYLGYKYEEGKGKTPFVPYVLAMANSGPNTNGSQFFITVGSFSGDFLNGKHTVFGKVLSGFDVVDEIEKVTVRGNDQPASDVLIKSITISVK